MRLPLHKVYRAFSELDRFGDNDCVRYVEQARRSARAAPTSADRVFVILVAVGIVAFLGALGPVVTRLINHIHGGNGRETVRRSLLPGLGVCAFGVAVMMGRDARLRSLVRRRLRTDSCSGCGRSLLGAECRWGEMECPGCGSKFSPMAAGLTPEDLLSRESAMDGLRVPITVRCPNCPASMADAPILDGKVRCKQCGEHYSVARLNLSHADFLRGRILDAMDGLAWPCSHPCPGCRYSTKGLLVTGGRVRCPECNLETAVRSLTLGREEYLAIAEVAGIGPPAAPASRGSA